MFQLEISKVLHCIGNLVLMILECGHMVFKFINNLINLLSWFIKYNSSLVPDVFTMYKNGNNLLTLPEEKKVLYLVIDEINLATNKGHSSVQLALISSWGKIFPNMEFSPKFLLALLMRDIVYVLFHFKFSINSEELLSSFCKLIF